MDQIIHTLKQRNDGRLTVTHASDNGGEQVESAVQAMCAFPWTTQDEMISLRDDKGRERCFVEKLCDIPLDKQKLILAEIVQRNFVPHILSIQAINRELELFHWLVTTTAGPRSFLTNRNDQFRYIHGHGVLVKDVSNDLYLIDDPEKLDAKSKKLVWVYLD